MRLAFDHQIFCLQKAGGISRYFCKLLEQLAQLDQTTGAFAPLYRNQYLQQVSKQSVHGHKIADYPRYLADFAVTLNGYLGRQQLKAWRPDLVHETYFSAIKSGPINRPSVLTVFDMIPELGLDGVLPTQAQLKSNNKYRAVSRADHVVCISEQTRQDLMRLFNVSAEKISTIHLGCDQDPMVNPTPTPVQADGRLAFGSLASKPFLLYVGLRQGYKNFSALLQSISSSSQLKNTCDLVAFGGGPFSEAELALISQLKFSTSQIRQVSGDDFVLAELYRHASAFVYPSLYEGFGLPPLEAMLYKCPVVSSNTSAMPEVLGGAAEFFDPRQQESIARAIEQVVFSNERRQELIDKGTQRVKRLTWRNCAERHLSLYQSLSAKQAPKI